MGIPCGIKDIKENQKTNTEDKLKCGKFKCPKCNQKFLNNFSKWQKKTIDNEEKWIFFGYDYTRPNVYLYYFYKNGDLVKYKEAEICWDYKGSTEAEWINNHDFKCYKCNYEPKTFTEFIPSYYMHFQNESFYESQNKKLVNENEKLIEENKQLKDKLVKNLDKNITSINPGEKIMTINFVSMGITDIVNYALSCKNTDLFVRLEEKLYKDFPKFKEYETSFEVNARKINRFKTLDENEIKNKDVINVFIVDNN